eukprot:SAG22_NODE_12208_length_452_cov_0.881020_1_plen_76_part_01
MCQHLQHQLFVAPLKVSTGARASQRCQKGALFTAIAFGTLVPMEPQVEFVQLPAFLHIDSGMLAFILNKYFKSVNK